MKPIAIEVGGFIFHSEEEAALANRELEGVNYIKSKLNIKNPVKVLEVYRNLVERRLFKTAVGLSFLYEIRKYLIGSPNLELEMIPAIDLTNQSNGEVGNKESKEHEGGTKQKTKQKAFINIGNRTTFTISVILAVTVIVMLLITVNSSSATILNYEDRIVNKYEKWEQELTEREQALDKLEQEHNQIIEEDDKYGED